MQSVCAAGWYFSAKVEEMQGTGNMDQGPGRQGLGGTMNREWHKEHKMPSGATAKERIEWHLEHTKNCACRPFPKELLERLSEKQRLVVRA
jgi:hypothetical protein